MQNTMEKMKANQGAHYEISIDGVPRTYRDRQDIDSRAATLDQAKAEFEASWKHWKTWAKMEETETRPPAYPNR
jgi:hypothetical protein